MTSNSRWRYTPHIIVALFVLLTAIMIWFISISFSTYSGLWTTNSYEKGLDFSQINKDSLPAQEYPYNARIDYDGRRFNVAFMGFTAKEVISIKSYLIQPSNQEKDRDVMFNSITETGMTSEPIKLSKGLWEIRLQIQLSNKEKYYFAKKLLID